MSQCIRHKSKDHGHHHHSRSHHKKSLDCKREDDLCDRKIKKVDFPHVKVACKKKLRVRVQFKQRIKLKKIECVPHDICEKSLSGSTCDYTTEYCEASASAIVDECFNEKLRGKYQTELFKPKCIDKNYRKRC